MFLATASTKRPIAMCFRLRNVILRQFAIAQYLRQQPASDGLAAMDGDGRTPSVGMAEKMVAAFDAYDSETMPTKAPNECDACKRRNVAHAITAMRWTPTNRFTTGSSSTSRHKAMASRIRFSSASKDFACVWQPRSDGTVATKYPSSSCSMITLNSFMKSTFLGLRYILPKRVAMQQGHWVHDTLHAWAPHRRGEPMCSPNSGGRTHRSAPTMACTLPCNKGISLITYH